MRYLGLLACVAVASVFFACGGDSNGNGGGPGITAGAGGEEGDTPSDGGTSNTGATASMGGEPDPGTTGGAGGEAPLGPASMGTPRNGVGQVVDGVVARSENFTMILSVGEEPGGNVSMISSQYRINLGVVGSTQK